MKHCLKCGKSLDEASDKGRPPAYCSLSCRRAAEMEIRRADKRLEALEVDAQNIRLGRMMDLGGKEEGKIVDEIKLIEARLKLLLGKR